MRVVIVLSAVFGLTCGARILGVLPMPSRSHSILLERLMRELGTRGHVITYVTATVPSVPIPNMRVVHVPGVHDAAMSVFASVTKSNNTFARRGGSPWMSILFGHMMSEAICEHMLSAASVQELIASDENFDLILGEIMMDESVLAGFSFHYTAPVIAMATTMPMYSANYLVGNVAPASFVPDLFLGYTSRMNLWQRLQNFLFGLATEANYKLRLLPQQDGIMKKYFGAGAPYIGDILRNTSLVLVNHHHALGFPRPYVPNMIEVAGVHINEPQPLPSDLQQMLDNAKFGVILFSLGTNANSSDMPASKISSILDGFARLPHLILWKFETELADTPPNVIVRKWLPQSDILAHPNLKLFITHGGLLSIIEAMTAGVPVVGVPLGGDQHFNMQQVQNDGWGSLLQFEHIDADHLYAAITHVINNPAYKEAALKKSAILKDNMLGPLERAIWWIEHVLRNGGEPLRSAAQDLAWYQFYLLDVYAFFTVFMCALLAFLCYIFKIFIKFIKLTVLF